jgi:hypothetical protein
MTLSFRSDLIDAGDILIGNDVPGSMHNVVRGSDDKFNREV